MIKTAPFIKMSASILRGPRTIPVAAEFKSEDFLYIPREINNHYRTWSEQRNILYITEIQVCNQEAGGKFPAPTIFKNKYSCCVNQKVAIVSILTLKMLLLFLIPLLSTRHENLRPFKIFVTYVNLRGGKGSTFVVGPDGHLASLRLWSCILFSLLLGVNDVIFAKYCNTKTVTTKGNLWEAAMSLGKFWLNYLGNFAFVEILDGTLVITTAPAL